VRLLDPPLHEFLPPVDDHKAMAALAEDNCCEPDDVIARVNELSEVNLSEELT
jgi:hypothetical protein